MEDETQEKLSIKEQLFGSGSLKIIKVAYLLTYYSSLN